MKRFLTSPLPKHCGVVQCYIRRNKNGTNKLFPIYSLYLKEGDVFLMASKKRPKNKTSNYLISSGQCAPSPVRSPDYSNLLSSRSQ